MCVKMGVQSRITTMVRLSCVIVLISLLPLATGLVEFACENADFSVSCVGSENIMVINSATYGIPRSSVADCPRTDDDDTICSARQAKSLVDERCAGRQGCEFKLIHHKFPVRECPENPANELVVLYECVPRDKLIDICSVSSEDLPLEGYLTSPYYPENYPTYTECVVTLPAQDGDDFLLIVKDLFIETRQATACLDYLLIRDTAFPDQDKKYCETIFNASHPDTMLGVVGNAIEVHFRSDTVHDQSSRGFLLYYKVTHIGPRKGPTSPSTTTTTTTEVRTSQVWKRPSTMKPSTIMLPTNTPSTLPSATPSTSTPTPLSTPSTSTRLATSPQAQMATTTPARVNKVEIPTGTTAKLTSVMWKSTPPEPPKTPAAKMTSAHATSTTTTTTTTTTPKPTTTTSPTTTTTTTTPKTTTTTQSSITVDVGASVTKSEKGLSTSEKIAVIVVVLGVFLIVFIILLLLWCRWKRSHKGSELLQVHYNRDSSLLSVPSNDSTGSSLSTGSTITPQGYPDIAFENKVYDYNYDHRNGGSSVLVGDSHIHPAPALTYEIPDELGKVKHVDTDVDGLPVDAPCQVDTGTDPDDLEMQAMATDTPPVDEKDIFIMDSEALDRKKRREEAKRDEPPEDLMPGTDLTLGREESQRLNTVPEISLGTDQVINIDAEKDKEPDKVSEGHYESLVPDLDSSMDESETIEIVADVENVPTGDEEDNSATEKTSVHDGDENNEKDTDDTEKADVAIGHGDCYNDNLTGSDVDSESISGHSEYNSDETEESSPSRVDLESCPDLWNNNNNANIYYDDDNIVYLDDEDIMSTEL